jgi:hypothetical protein
MRKRIFKKAVAIALMCSSPGCITQALWKPAGEDLAVGPQIAGVVANYPWPGARSLIVRYRAAGDGTDVDLVVPVKADGRAVEPFAVTYVRLDAAASTGPVDPSGPHGPHLRVRSGDSNLQLDLAKAIGLTPERVAGILATQSTIPADRQRLGPYLSSSNFTPVAGGQFSERKDGAADSADSVHLLSYRFDSPGRLFVGPADALPDQWGDVGAQDMLIAVPTAVRRPPGDRGRNQLVAGVLTPVTVAGDVGGTALLVGAGAAVLGGALVVAVVVLPVAGVVALISAVEKPNQPTSVPAR